jgi:hypothetical protein
MREELTMSSLPQFQERFPKFHESLIISSYYKPFYRPPQFPKAVIIVGTRDVTRDATSLRQWVNLTFEIEDVEEFILKDTLNYTFSIIDSLSIHFTHNLIYLDFRGGINLPTYYYERPKHPYPELSIVAKRCFFSVGDYNEGAIPGAEG